MPQTVPHPPQSNPNHLPVLSLSKEPPGGRPAVILLVEDSADDAALIRLIFRQSKLPYPLFVVEDIVSAFCYLRGEGMYSDRSRYPFPTLLLLDLKFPAGSGFEVLEWLRHQADLQRLVTVVLSGSNQQSDIQHAYHLGANAYVVKSPHYEDLINLLKSFHLLG
jgi:CheY-like chemotaxis protein